MYDNIYTEIFLLKYVDKQFIELNIKIAINYNGLLCKSYQITWYKMITNIKKNSKNFTHGILTFKKENNLEENLTITFTK